MARLEEQGQEGGFPGRQVLPALSNSMSLRKDFTILNRWTTMEAETHM